MGTVRLPKVVMHNAALPMAKLAGHNTNDMGYIRDGLVFHLDGINKGPNKDLVTDLVGGIVFKPINYPYQGKIGADYIQGTWIADVPVICPIENSTIEISLEYVNVNNNGSGLYFNSGYSDNVCLGAWLKCLFCTHDQNHKISLHFPSIVDTKQHCFSCNKNLFVIDNVGYKKLGTQDFWILRGSYAIINAHDGGVINENSRSPLIRSIRIYNRLLTEEEMRHNQAVDATRFNLKLQEPIMTAEYIEPQDDLYLGYVGGNGV